jgi:hypothetical protein
LKAIVILESLRRVGPDQKAVRLDHFPGKIFAYSMFAPIGFRRKLGVRNLSVRLVIVGWGTLMCMACASSAPPQGHVWGQVKTAENQPAPNVPIAVAKLENGHTVAPVASTMTNVEGRYMLDVRQLPPGDYVVILNPGPSMAGGHIGGQTTIALDGPNDSHRLNWTLRATPPVLPDPE